MIPADLKHLKNDLANFSTALILLEGLNQGLTKVSLTEVLGLLKTVYDALQTDIDIAHRDDLLINNTYKQLLKDSQV